VAVREQLPVYDVTSGSLRVQHVEAGQLIVRSGGGEDDPGRGSSAMPDAHTGTVNPHQFLANLYAHAADCPTGS
jgi:hypothetical protein